jgi:catechol 2,3-dioxygenase-like lactoylglutathione lyase family enzyme
MILGAHVMVYSKDAEADRAFFRDVLGFKSVDASYSGVQQGRWGSIAKMRLPGGSAVGFYQPKHPTTLGLK